MINIIYLQRFLLFSAFVLHSAVTDDEKERAALFLMTHNRCVHSYIQKMVLKNAAKQEVFSFIPDDDFMKNHIQSLLERRNITFDDMQNTIQKMSTPHGLQTWWSHLTKEKEVEERARVESVQICQENMGAQITETKVQAQR
ncbi:MAG: hypothetical protein OXC30_02665 [Alphaproteobacteria bacterium]|nr:hypothetical protein [Alphaproteobacteria bacterium]